MNLLVQEALFTENECDHSFDLSVGRSVCCPRCRRIMPLRSLDGVGDKEDQLFTLEDDEPEYEYEWSCPQCHFFQRQSGWTGNIFYCEKEVPGTWRAMMAWRRSANS